MEPPILSLAPSIVPHSPHTWQVAGVYSETIVPFPGSRPSSTCLLLTLYNAVSTHPWPAIPQWPCFLSGLLVPVSSPSHRGDARGALLSNQHGWVGDRYHFSGQKWHLRPGLSHPPYLEMSYSKFTCAWKHCCGCDIWVWILKILWIRILAGMRVPRNPTPVGLMGGSSPPHLLFSENSLKEHQLRWPHSLPTVGSGAAPPPPWHSKPHTCLSATPCLPSWQDLQTLLVPSSGHASSWPLLPLPPGDWVILCPHFPFFRLPEAVAAPEVVAEAVAYEAGTSLCPWLYTTLSLLPCKTLFPTE